MRSLLRRLRESGSRGFTLIEVLISMAITIIVMGAVFGLLTRGQQSFQREPQVADLQQSARTALDMISRDVMQAGSGLPPEFPALTPKAVDSTVGDQGTDPDVLEIVGAAQVGGAGYASVEQVTGFDGVDVVSVNVAPSSLQIGDLVVVYNDQETGSDWLMGWVTEVNVVDPGPGSPQTDLTVQATYDGHTVPAPYSNLDNSLTTGLITRVSVVRYQTQVVGDDLILTRRVNFGDAMPVGMIDDFQVVYLTGTQPQVEQVDPPHPHPDEAAVIDPVNIISGVRVTVVGRSADENLMGSTEGDSGDYIRKAFSSNISTRNILAGCQDRTGGLCSN